ncbi:MAG: PorT family protein [Bacteroidota bacterium]|nr:PorT family protein [Bacteroidota bacterium]
MKNLINTFILMFFVSTIFAQKGKFYIGINACMQNTWIMNSEDYDRGGELDFTTTFYPAFGLNLGYNLSDKMGLQSGVIYSFQGQNYITAGNTHADYSTDLTYIKIPLVVTYLGNVQKNVSFLGQVGVQLSLNQKATSSRNQAFGIYGGTDLVDVKNKYSPYTVDIILGSGINVNLSKSLDLQALIRIDYSLTDIEDIDVKPSSRPQSSSLTLGLPQINLLYTFGR